MVVSEPPRLDEVWLVSLDPAEGSANAETVSTALIEMFARQRLAGR